MDLVAVLGSTALFKELSNQELELLAPALRSRAFTKGAYIFQEGDIGNALYVIHSGQVKISRMGAGGEEAVYAVLMPGDSFGEIALLSESTLRTADAQALARTQCVSLGRDTSVAFLDRRPTM